MIIKWLVNNAGSITIWCAALSTFAIYSILYAENKFYRFFEHVFLGLATGYGVYMTWSQVLGPMWWNPMIKQGQWYWAFAGVAGSMFYFMYSRKNMWISRLIFGAFMGLAAGSMFRDFYEVYFPQIGSSMKPIYEANKGAMHSVSVFIFYIILLSSMTYFFFSFEHKNAAVKKTASLGRWFLMIGFGAIFGATVMGRMTLFIGRFNFLLNSWVPEVRRSADSWIFWVIAGCLAVLAVYYMVKSSLASPRKKKI